MDFRWINGAQLHIKRVYGLRMSQRELAEQLGIPPNTVARWERGDLAIRHDRLLFLALRGLEREVPSRMGTSDTLSD